MFFLQFDLNKKTIETNTIIRQCSKGKKKIQKPIVPHLSSVNISCIYFKWSFPNFELYNFNFNGSSRKALKVFSNQLFIGKKNLKKLSFANTDLKLLF